MVIDDIELQDIELYYYQNSFNDSGTWNTAICEEFGIKHVESKEKQQECKF